jgi:hypothetical protein
MHSLWSQTAMDCWYIDKKETFGSRPPSRIAPGEFGLWMSLATAKRKWRRVSQPMVKEDMQHRQGNFEPTPVLFIWNSTDKRMKIWSTIRLEDQSLGDENRCYSNRLNKVCKKKDGPCRIYSSRLPSQDVMFKIDIQWAHPNWKLKKYRNPNLIVCVVSCYNNSHEPKNMLFCIS